MSKLNREAARKDELQRRRNEKEARMRRQSKSSGYAKKKLNGSGHTLIEDETPAIIVSVKFEERPILPPRPLPLRPQFRDSYLY